MGQTESTALRVSVTLVMLFQVSALFIREFVRLELGESGLDAVAAKHWSVVPGFIALCVFIWPLLRGQLLAVRKLFQMPRSWLRLILCSIAIGLALRVGSWTAVAALTASGFHGQANTLRATGPVTWWMCPPLPHLVLSIGVMVILTPLIEEVISRGLILRSLLHHGRTFAVVVSAVLFALLHVYDSVPFAFVFGVIAAIQMQSAQTLWGPVIAHATYNLTVIFDQHCLNSSWVAGATSAAFTTGAILLTILTVFTAAWLARQNSAGARKASGTDFC